MYSTIFIATLIFVSIAAFDVDHIPMGKHGKTYPSQTIYDKDGQYVRLVGPLYGKMKVDSLKFPLRYWQKLNISGSVVPTVEIASFFASGVIKFNGISFYRLNGNVDQCLIGSLKGGCPYLPGVPAYDTITLAFGDIGLFPGWYESAIDMFTTDKEHQKFRVARLEFKIKILES